MARPVDTFHPVVQAVYFAAVLVLVMAGFHPVITGMALLSGLACGCCLRGPGSVAKSLLWQLPLIGLVAVFNPLVSASGSTELFCLGTRAIYLESLAYGLVMGGLLASMMVWFSNAAHVVTTDKTMLLLGNLAPVLAVMVSLATRLVPRFVDRGRSVLAVTDVCVGAGQGPSDVVRPTVPPASGPAASAAATSGAGPAASAAASTASGPVVPTSAPPATASVYLGSGRFAATSKIRRYSRLTSVLMGWCMEDSLDTADAMRARGWGHAPRRTTYQRRTFTTRDGIALAVLLAWALVAGALTAVACTQFSFYPTMSTLILWWGYVPIGLFFLLPLAVLLVDDILWRP